MGIPPSGRRLRAGFPAFTAEAIMQDFPHRYRVGARGEAAGDVVLESPALPALVSAPPAEFGGPGDRWSPETLLVAAVADCFILTFRAVARAARLTWLTLQCEVEGTLDRVDRVTRFTAFTLRAELTVPPGTADEAARRALERAEGACLVSNSLEAPVHLELRVTTAQADEAVAVQ